MLLNNHWITGEIRGNEKKKLETSENERTVVQNLRDAAKQL